MSDLPAPPTGPVDRFIAGVARLSQLSGVIAAALLLAAVAVITHLVFVRYVLVASAIWQHEFVTFSLIAATFIGSPYVLLTRGHVNVDLLPQYVRGRARFALALLAQLIALAFCLLLTWKGFDFWYKAWAGDWHAETVWRPPLWIPYASLPLGMGLLTLQLIADVTALVTGRTEPFAAADIGAGGAR